MHHKRSLIVATENPADKSVKIRKKIPAGWEKVAPCFNQTALEHVNDMAKVVGVSTPFLTAEQLPQNNGERFFSQCAWEDIERSGQETRRRWVCLCKSCSTPATSNPTINRPANELRQMPQQQQEQPTMTTNNTERPRPVQKKNKTTHAT